MNHSQLQQEIISCIRSNCLRKRIEESGHVFSETELLGIAYQFAPTYERRLQLLQLLAECAPSVSDHAKRCIAWEENKLREFRQTGESQLYELQIKTEPDAYEERYLCATYDAALEMIDGFYREYSCKENETSRYRIVKRKVLQPGEDFDEDSLGECDLGPGKVLLSVTSWSDETENGECTHDCLECENRCAQLIEVDFPAFLPDYAAVQRHHWDGSSYYGIYFPYDYPGDTCYIVPLDAEKLKKRDYKEADFWGHDHAPAPEVDQVTVEELPAELREAYLAYLEYLRSKKEDRS